MYFCDLVFFFFKKKKNILVQLACAETSEYKINARNLNTKNGDNFIFTYVVYVYNIYIMYITQMFCIKIRIELDRNSTPRFSLPRLDKTWECSVILMIF